MQLCELLQEKISGDIHKIAYHKPLMVKIKQSNILLSIALAVFFFITIQHTSLAKSASGGLAIDSPKKEAKRAKLIGRKLVPPKNAPRRIKKVILAANKITNKPYIYGGGHGSFYDRGYDCSGAVSFALHGGNFLRRPLTSGSLMSWGKAGRGRWLTVFSHSGHAFLLVAGWRFDTSGTGGKGPRWHRDMTSTRGFKARSVVGY